MDSDRKSTVSSFYGGRRSSVDALNRDYAAAPPSSDPRARRDSSSSFFNPAGTGALPRGAGAPGRTNGAGYNRMSYFDAGREEPVKGGHDEVEQPNEGGWDVYADFNNAGPRYSHAFGIGNNDTSYQQLPPQVLVKMDEESDAQGPVEMVTVPALGAEWGKDELKDMTNRGRREKNNEDLGRKWKMFNRGQYGLFGSKWLTRRTLVFSLFGLCGAIGIILAFTIPRVPSFSINGQTPLVRRQAGLTSLSRRIQSLPCQLLLPGCRIAPGRHRLELPTSHFQPPGCTGVRPQFIQLVGRGHLNRTKLPANHFTNILMPINFTYVATNDSDQTWLNWYAACKNKIQYSGGVRPGIQFRLNIDMDISGLPTQHSTATTVTNAACPIELPASAG
ncbi:hypothetical protein EI94DRAFT_1747188 [Lactarius quietus]|nr:hypothetical protein EI94DRAFT_1747188 [Lactarius quietus]